jgi:hypothetical protein
LRSIFSVVAGRSKHRILEQTNARYADSSRPHARRRIVPIDAPKGQHRLAQRAGRLQSFYSDRSSFTWRMVHRSERNVIGICIANLRKRVTRANHQKPGESFRRCSRWQVNAICAASKGNISTRIDENARAKRLKFKQLSRRQILLPDLYKIDSEVHLIPDHLKQGSEPSDCFSICYVVAFHEMEIGRTAIVIGYERK